MNHPFVGFRQNADHSAQRVRLTSLKIHRPMASSWRQRLVAVNIGKANLIWLITVAVLVALKIDPGACRVESSAWRGDAAHATSLLLGYVAISVTTYVLALKATRRG